MVYYGMLTVNGYAYPSPAKFKYDHEDIDADAGRNMLGTMLRNRIASKRKLTIEWDYIPDTAAYRLFVTRMESLPENFSITFPHPSGDKMTITAYRGNPFSCELLAYFDNGTDQRWKTSCNFIEA